MTFRLRKAEGADLDFIWRLRVATMKEAISQSYGWDEETQRGYAAESLRGEIVLIDERPVGVLLWQIGAMNCTSCGWPFFRRCNDRAGQCLDRALPAAGSRSRKAITLQVLRNNPAVSCTSGADSRCTPERAAQVVDALDSARRVAQLCARPTHLPAELAADVAIRQRAQPNRVGLRPATGSLVRLATAKARRR